MLDDLEFDFTKAKQWFTHEQEQPFVLVRVSDEHAQSWSEALGLAVRRCYVCDSLVTAKSLEHNVSGTEIIAARMPDAGATMAGDFGEILVYLYQSAQELPVEAFGPKKWRLKQDRTKPAPHSDVVHFVLPSWPNPSDKDILLCAEVKTKSTDGDSTPIKSAIADCEKDRTSRLGRTLHWLKERALLEPLGDVQVAHLDRFIRAIEFPPAIKRFRAVAVVCRTLLEAELKSAPATASADFTLVVIGVPDLRNTYAAVFDAAKKSLPPATPAKSTPSFLLEGSTK